MTRNMEKQTEKLVLHFHTIYSARDIVQAVILNLLVCKPYDDGWTGEITATYNKLKLNK